MNKEKLIYFELNTWACGEGYPDAEPFLSWMSDCYETKEEEEKSWFTLSEKICNDLKNEGVCVAVSVIDMSLNYCITAPISWINKNCPELLTKYTNFLRLPNTQGEVIGKFGDKFIQDYKKENFGVWYSSNNNYRRVK